MLLSNRYVTLYLRKCQAPFIMKTSVYNQMIYFCREINRKLTSYRESSTETNKCFCYCQRMHGSIKTTDSINHIKKLRVSFHISIRQLICLFILIIPFLKKIVLFFILLKNLNMAQLLASFICKHYFLLFLLWIIT